MVLAILPMVACEGAARQKQSTGIALLNRYAIKDCLYETPMWAKAETVSFKLPLPVLVVIAKADTQVLKILFSP